MPPRLPNRYRLNIRLGSDGDIEEWLGQDETLDRPVLIRYLAPESTPDRRRSFLAGVQSAAALTEVHLQRVFAAGETSASAYSVSEWDGGVTIADRLRVGESVPVEEFLPNASGICMALGRFHEAGATHGAIDTSAVHFSAAHPVKIGAFGRKPLWTDQQNDTIALAHVLRAAITGTDDPTVYPSQVIDGITDSVDVALMQATSGEMTAGELGTALSSTAYTPAADQTPPKPWRTLLVLGTIAALIALIAAVGLAADFDPDSPFLYPVAAESGSPPATTPIEVAVPDESEALNTNVVAYDPFGDGTESDGSVNDVLDGNQYTAWATEAYSKPLRDLKDGVGLVFTVDGAPSAMYVVGTPGTTYLVGWAPSTPNDPASWEHIARGTLQASETRIQLPNRTAGMWRLWLTGLPQRADGSYQSRIAEVRFVQ